MSKESGRAARRDGNDLLLAIRVQPRASRNEILDVSNAQLRIRPTAAPTDGRGNQAVIRLLAGYLGVPPASIRLTHGARHRNKRLIVAGPVAAPAGLAVAAQASNGL
ncbi:MAG: DUF167 domain-containing protein [Gammaproteobacteria bacterium]|nr:DUF167 domain-containing protein [Gammaproteobacteria bacterium]MDH3409350.1 DUF167 domain-containing protein [Gammaproteobacteria bacterium]